MMKPSWKATKLKTFLKLLISLEIPEKDVNLCVDKEAPHFTAHVWPATRQGRSLLRPVAAKNFTSGPAGTAYRTAPDLLGHRSAAPWRAAPSSRSRSAAARG